MEFAIRNKPKSESGQRQNTSESGHLRFILGYTNAALSQARNVVRKAGRNESGEEVGEKLWPKNKCGKPECKGRERLGVHKAVHDGIGMRECKRQTKKSEENQKNVICLLWRYTNWTKQTAVFSQYVQAAHIFNFSCCSLSPESPWCIHRSKVDERSMTKAALQRYFSNRGWMVFTERSWNVIYIYYRRIREKEWVLLEQGDSTQDREIRKNEQII